MVISSEFFTPECRSTKIVSVRECTTIRWLKALAALSLTCLFGSCNDFKNVVCNWGKNCFKLLPALASNKATVSRIADLMFHVYRSFKIRMRGPVMFNTGDVNPSFAATFTTSPQP